MAEAQYLANRHGCEFGMALYLLAMMGHDKATLIQGSDPEKCTGNSLWCEI